jgi:hypothetical protein
MAASDRLNIRNTAMDTRKDAAVNTKAVHLTVFCPAFGHSAMTAIPITGKKIIQLNKFRFKAIYLS